MLLMTSISLLIIGLIIYTSFVIVMLRGLGLSKYHSLEAANFPPVSVVIAARNEEDNLPQLLDDLIHQNYPRELLNIYIADDRSTDATASILRKHSAQYDFIHDIHISKPSTEMTSKKNALTQCIKQVKTDIILSCDADIRLEPDWVKSMALAFNDDIGVITSYSSVAGGSIFSKYQAIDFLGIQISNAGMMNLGYHWSGTGQNIAYRKSSFIQIDGFRPVADKTSDDDMYLIQSIAGQTNRNALFNWHPKARVQTYAMNDLKSFINQRIRWSSNSKGLEKNEPLFFIFLLSAYFTNLGILTTLFFAPLSSILWISIIIKFIGEGAILYKGSHLVGEKRLLAMYPLWFVMQPLYISFMGIAGIFGKYSWKP